MCCVNREISNAATKNAVELRNDRYLARRANFSGSLQAGVITAYSGQQDPDREEWAVELRRLHRGVLSENDITTMQDSLNLKAEKFAENLLFTSDASFVLPGMKQALAALATR
jgi:hypothetical protein